MHEHVLARAALPAPTVCLGMLLKPYSIAHELWLTREDNTLSAVEALPAAVLICCQTWSELARMRSDPLLKLKLWVWRKRIKNLSQKQTKKTKEGGRAQAPSLPSVKIPYLNQELAKFLAYRAEGLLEFPLSEIQHSDRKPGRISGAPFMLSLQQWLMLTLRLTEAEAWDYPVGLAKMRWATYWEREGGLEICNEQEAEFDAAVARKMAELAAGNTTR